MSYYKVIGFIKKIPGNLFLLIMFLFVILPVGWLFLSSVRPGDIIMSYPPEYFPSVITFDHYLFVQKILPVWNYMWNTFVFTITVTTVAVFVNALAGYAFARVDFRGKNIIFACLLATMMIPFHVVMIPLFMELHWMGLLNTFAGLVLPRFAGVVGVFFMRSFFFTLPKQLEEAARIDGLREFSIFLRIMLPLCKPAMITQIVLHINGNWNDLLWPLLIISSPEKRMLSNGVSYFMGSDSINYGGLFAAGTISVTPILILFIFCQQFFVNSIVSSGIKE